MRGTLLILAMSVFFSGCSRQSPKSDMNEATELSPASGQPSRDTNTRESPLYPSPETWEYANRRQRDRAARSFALLKAREFPAFSGPLFVDDDAEVKLQSPQDVARRTLVLWAVVMRAEGMPQEEAVGLLENLDLWGSVSPEEKLFLQDDDPDDDKCQALVWRLESLWVLLWALGYIDVLDWPSGMCDVPKLVQCLQAHEANSEFITNAKLRSTAEILDAQDLIMRIHWGVRDAYLHRQGIIPKDLDWSQDFDIVHISKSPAVGVVEQRHYTLNWLTNFLDPVDWDHVDTPT